MLAEQLHRSRRQAAAIRGRPLASGTLNRRLEEVLAPVAEAVARLDTIPGINRRTAEVLIAELGLDISVFRPRPTSRAGRGCVPATTKAPANTNRARLERGTAGCAPP